MIGYPVTIHLPAGQQQVRAGAETVLFVSVAQADAEGVLTAVARNWSAYLHNYCGLLLDVDRLRFEHTVRDGEPVILARTTLQGEQ